MASRRKRSNIWSSVIPSDCCGRPRCTFGFPCVGSDCTDCISNAAELWKKTTMNLIQFNSIQFYYFPTFASCVNVQAINFLPQSFHSISRHEMSWNIPSKLKKYKYKINHTTCAVSWPFLKSAKYISCWFDSFSAISASRSATRFLKSMSSCWETSSLDGWVWSLAESVSPTDSLQKLKKN